MLTLFTLILATDGSVIAQLPGQICEIRDNGVVPYVADQKPDYKRGAIKAVRNFAIMALALVGFAFALVWSMGWLGPLRLERLTETEALTRCQNSIRWQLGEVAGAEFGEATVLERTNRWTVSGDLVSEGQLGGFWLHRYRCEIEAHRNTWGITANFLGLPTRLDEVTE